MPQTEYDLLVIGAGAAGSTAASTAAEQGHRVALIERDRLGGTCLNYGCDPTKALLHVAHLLYHAQHSEHYGLDIPSAAANWDRVEGYVKKVVNTIRGGTHEEAKTNIEAQGIDLFMGEAHFVSPHEVAVGDQALRAKRIIIATGSAPVIPECEGVQETGFITNVEAVSLPKLPKSLAIIGGGPIGIEFAQLFHRFGVEVTVLEQAPALLSKDDQELADRLCGLLGNEGIRLETNVDLRRAERASDGKRLTIRCGDKDEEILVVEEVLLATGRKPRYDTLHPDKAGIETNEDGMVVSDTLRTSVAHIWVAGDVARDFPFTHVAAAQANLAIHNAFADEAQAWNRHAIPWVTYTDPELAHVGKTEEELKEEGTAYRVGRLELKKLDRAITEGETEGLVKLLADEKGKLLGGHILAPRAGELIAPVVLAMRQGLDVSALAETILPYPTLTEGVRWAATELESR
jgi:pyruvate/2-oxoglutarate dehydrogenase complex dihydrolipoamide dehydrogenase (E3) component